MQYFLDDFLLVKTIGKGNFGEVFLTQRKGTKELYATKKMERRVYEKPPLLNRLYNEVQILRMINHPNIVKFIDLKKTQNSYYLITEYINGDSLTSNLKKYMSHYGKPFPEDIVQYLMKQIVSALQYLHLNRIIHRDLKLDNILVNFANDYDMQTFNLMNSQIKIIDFGFAKILNSELTFTALGTPHNMDPKILEQINTGMPNQGYNEKADIWSLGTLCYEMAVGYPPFQGTCMQDLYQKVQQGIYNLPSTLSDELITFINDMLQQDEEKRADTSQLMKHPFLNNPVNSFHAVDVNKIQANYTQGGMINMKSKQPEVNYNYNINIWTIFNQQQLYQGANSTNQIPAQYQIQQNTQNGIYTNGVKSEFTAINQPTTYYYNVPNNSY